MTKSWPQGLPVRVDALDAEGAPVAFAWHGQTHPVEQVLQRWEVDTDWWSHHGAVRRAYAAVITQTGLLCVLFFDFDAGEWRIARLYD